MNDGEGEGEGEDMGEAADTHTHCPATENGAAWAHFHFVGGAYE